MKVEDVMTIGVVTVRDDMPFKGVAETLLAQDVSALPVVDRDGRVLGVVSEADLLLKEGFPPTPRRRRLPKFLMAMAAGLEDPWSAKARALVARDLMTAPAIVARPDEDLHTVARRMVERGVKRLPVVDDGKLRGILSRHDVLRVFAATDDRLGDVVERMLHRSAFIPPEFVLHVVVNEGVVRLEGSVPAEDDITVIEGIVGAIDGVIAVENRLLYRNGVGSRS